MCQKGKKQETDRNTLNNHHHDKKETKHNNKNKENNTKDGKHKKKIRIAMIVIRKLKKEIHLMIAW